MYFLVQIRLKDNGEYEKGTSQYADYKTALIQLHVAMSSAMAKEDTVKVCCIVMDDEGNQLKYELYTAEASK
ncbi:MAG: hypothetical protein KBS60_04225 [Phascolarctobacterium sp.]|nr:hypothetical protein [Candidatus Phascolarctobacterium caballi]